MSDVRGGETSAATVPALRPRYGRITAAGTAALVTLVAVLAGGGVLPSGGDPSYAASGSASTSTDGAAAVLSGAESARAQRSPDEAADPAGGVVVGTVETDGSDSADEPSETDLELPADSGEGRRVVFDEGTQRVWLVKADDSVERTYLVSGSLYDNLDPGTYAVYSRDKKAWGIDGSELRRMVRFTTGAEAAIGFHNIPLLDGERVQTRDELGTPLSHGCIRQKQPDAKALWDFAPLGTAVVVVDSAPVGVDQSDED
jgi:hypothetical protein